MDNKGGWSREVKLRVGRQVAVRHESPTGAIFLGEQQQPNVDTGSNECMTETEICEFITLQSWKR